MEASNPLLRPPASSSATLPMPQPPRLQEGEAPEDDLLMMGDQAAASPSVLFPSVPPPRVVTPPANHHRPRSHHTPFDYEYLFLSQQASFDVKDLMSHRATKDEWEGHWISPPVSKNPLADGHHTSRGPVHPAPPPPLLPLHPEARAPGESPMARKEIRVLELFDRQMSSHASPDMPPPRTIYLDQLGNWPFAHQHRLQAEQAESWKLKEFKRLREDNEMRRKQEEEMLEKRRRTLYVRLFMEWLGSRNFGHEYHQFLLNVPRRLTRKELLKLKETVYKITVKKLVHGFGHIRRAFRVPTSDGNHDLDCLHDITSLFMYSLPASQLLKVLLSPELRLSPVEVEIILELKLGFDPLVTQMLLENHPDSGDSLPYDPVIRFDEFCTAVLPVLGEVKAMLRKEEREKLQKEIDQQEREKKMGVVWERIKRRRMEMKLDLELAFKEVQAPMSTFDSRVMTILQKVVATGSKWWEGKQRRKFEHALKTRFVLIDIKYTLIKCVMEGVNLGGMRPKDLARVIQNYCSLRIQTAFRCHARYHKYRAAMGMYHQRIEKFRREVYLAFKEVLVVSLNIKKYCRRVVYRWHRWMLKRRKMCQFFLLVHWPFHVWWRYTICKLHAKDKSRFLAAVWKTYLKLRVFRGIKRFSGHIIRGKAEIRPFRLRKGVELCKEVFRCWHLYCRERHRLRVNWEASGQYMEAAIQSRALTTHFAVWRYWSHARHLIKERGPQFFRSGFMDLEKYRNDCTKKARAVAKAKRRDKAGSQMKKQEQELDYLSAPYLLSMPQTAWETGRPAHPGKRPHLMPVFPLLEEIKYYQGQAQDDAIDPALRELCQPLHQLYCVKDRQEVIVSYMMYRRSGPQALKCLREWVQRCKKRRYAVVHASLVLEARVFRAWTSFPKIKRSEEQQARLERARQEEEEAQKLLDPFNRLAPMEKDVVIRKQEQSLAAEVAKRVEALADEEEVEVQENMQMILEKQSIRRKVQLLSGHLIEQEQARALGADQKAMAWSNNFKRNAVESLVYGLIRMQASIRHHEDHGKVKDAFRVLRFLYIEGKAQHINNYFRLRRWLQICVRYRKLTRAMPIYYRLKTKWLTWHRWLQYLHTLYMTRTPGLSKSFKKRRPLVLRLSGYLYQSRLIHTHYDYAYLNPILLTKPAVFYRLVLYTQKRIAYRRMTQLARRLHQIRLLRRALCGWSSGMSTTTSYMCYRRREASIPFLEKRVMADMGVLRTWVFSACRGSLDHAILIRNKRWKWLLRQSVLNAPSFKASITDYEDTLKARFLLERSLLFEAFRQRGELEFKDTVIPTMVGTKKEKEIGTCFSTTSIPGAYLISAVEVYYKKSRGITGIILVVTPGEFTRRKDRLPAVGHTHGGVPDVFTLRHDEKIVKMEISMGIVLEQLRFTTDSGRCSKWLGKPINHALATKMSLSGQGKHETLIGFHGTTDSIRILTLGIKVRRVTKETLFSYYWVENKAVPLTVKKVDIYAKGDEEEGAPEAPPSPAALPLDSPDQEMVLLVAMRNADLMKAMTRASSFAKKLWETQTIPPGLAVLYRPHVMMGMLKWFFESLAKGLVPMPCDKKKVDDMVLRAGTLNVEGLSLPQKVEDLQRLAHKLRAAPRPWNTRGVVTPAERASEAEYMASIAEIEAEADRLEVEAHEMVQQGEKVLQEARALCPALPCNKRTRAYYRNLLSIVKAHNQLHAFLGVDAFKSLVNFGAKDADQSTAPQE